MSGIGGVASPRSPGRAGRLAGLSGLRGVAALSIVVAHVWDYGAPDHAGPPDVPWFERLRELLGLSVVLFFSLSGFLLYRRFAAAVLGFGPRPSVGDYGKGRALRILPTYWVILLVCGVVASAALVRDDTGRLVLGNLLEHPWTLAADAAFVQNLVPPTTVTGIGPAWTLVIELCFYVVMPLLALPVLALAAGRHARTRLWLSFVPAAVLLVTGLAAKEAARVFPALGAGDGWNPDWPSVFQRSFVYHADLFAAGMAAAVMSLLVAHGSLTVRAGTQRVALASAAVLFGVIAWADAHGLYPAVLYEATMSGVFALVIIGLATGERSRAASVFELRWLVAIGTASYSLFLWHEPITRLLSADGATLPGGDGFVLNLALVLAIAVPLSLLSYRWVEAPSMALRQRRLRRRASETVPSADIEASPRVSG